MPGQVAGAVVQPGAAVGDRTYCPVSGVVFSVKADSAARKVGERTLWFCCEACASYFALHEHEVLAARTATGAGDRSGSSR